MIIKILLSRIECRRDHSHAGSFILKSSFELHFGSRLELVYDMVEWGGDVSLIVQVRHSFRFNISKKWHLDFSAVSRIQNFNIYGKVCVYKSIRDYHIKNTKL